MDRYEACGSDIGEWILRHLKLDLGTRVDFPRWVNEIADILRRHFEPTDERIEEIANRRAGEICELADEAHEKYGATPLFKATIKLKVEAALRELRAE